MFLKRRIEGENWSSVKTPRACFRSSIFDAAFLWWLLTGLLGHALFQCLHDPAIQAQTALCRRASNALMQVWPEPNVELA